MYFLCINIIIVDGDQDSVCTEVSSPPDDDDSLEDVCKKIRNIDDRYNQRCIYFCCFCFCCFLLLFFVVVWFDRCKVADEDSKASYLDSRSSGADFVTLGSIVSSKALKV